MSGLVVPQVASGLSTDELADLVAKLSKEVDWFANGNIDSQNVRNIAGFNVSAIELKHVSGIVGMSGANPSTATAVRFWSGAADKDIAPFRVLQNGKFFATDGELTGKITAQSGTIGGWLIGADYLKDAAGTVGMSSAVTAGDDIRIWAGSATPSDASFQVTEAGNVTIQGGTLRTGATNQARIALTGAGFRGLTSDSLLSGLVFIPTVTDVVDLFLYHRGAKLVEFFDDLTQYKIRGASAATGFRLGGNGITTYAEGTWDFSGATISGIPTSAITGLETRLAYLENRAFINATRVGANVQFDSKNTINIDTVDVSG